MLAIRAALRARLHHLRVGEASDASGVGQDPCDESELDHRCPDGAGRDGDVHGCLKPLGQRGGSRPVRRPALPRGGAVGLLGVAVALVLQTLELREQRRDPRWQCHRSRGCPGCSRRSRQHPSDPLLPVEGHGQACAPRGGQAPRRRPCPARPRGVLRAEAERRAVAPRVHAGAGGGWGGVGRSPVGALRGGVWPDDVPPHGPREGPCQGPVPRGRRGSAPTTRGTLPGRGPMRPSRRRTAPEGEGGGARHGGLEPVRRLLPGRQGAHRQDPSQARGARMRSWAGCTTVDGRA